MRRAHLLVLLTFAILVQGPAARGEEYYSQEKCSLCHIRQSVFFSPGFASPEALKTFGEERVCYSCHNGSVRDSRAVLWRGAQHPPVGNGDKSDGKKCSRCHSPHAKGGWGVLAGTSISLRRGGDGTCTGCHGAYERGAGNIHRTGFPEGGCGECHRAHGGTGKALLRESRATLCFRCHPDADSGKSGGHPVSRPGTSPSATKPLPECAACHPVHRMAAGEGIDSQCAGCHPFSKIRRESGGKGHPSEGTCTACHRFHAKTGKGGKGLRGEDIRPDLLCGTCHLRQVADGRSKARERGTHPTRAAGGSKDLCFRCHRIHKGTPGTALLVSAKSYSCLECHEGQNTISEVAGIVLAHPVFERVEKGRLAEVARTRRLTLGPAGEIVCRTCHAVHGATPDTALLASGSAGDGSCLWCHERMEGMDHLPPGKASTGPGCGTCHPVHGKRSASDAASPWTAVCTTCHAQSASHGPGGHAGALGRADLPEFDGRGRTIRAGAISCPTCHDPHGKPLNSRLRRPYAVSGFICTGCHRDKESVALTPHDLRGIKGKSICEPCHRPHGGKDPWMWGLSREGGEGEGAACRSCHGEKGMGKPVPRGGHPVNVPLPRPVTDTFPLFSAAGDKAKNGVVTCATCHEVHGTGFLPTGQGTGLLLRAETGQAAEDLGRIRACLPCHQGKQEKHGQADCIWCHPPHDDTKAGPDCQGCHAMSGKGTAQTHAGKQQGCGGCHRIHTAKSGSGPERGCLGCHPSYEKVVGTAHAEMEGGACRPCHPAHEAVEDKPFKRRGWEETFVPDLPCLRCHREEGPGRAVALGDHPKSRRKVPTNYGAIVTLDTPIAMVGRLQEGGIPLFPLFDDNGRKSMSGRMGCLTCHNPHAGTTMSTGDNRRTAAGYLRDTSGVFLAELCAPCHRETSGEHAQKFHDLPRKTD
ncbi:MAG TPA: cytochrome c3 family protein [Candidatus Deferrimicrobiaceae bacterium]